MILSGFGELLVDILTVNPAFSSIPSASAILDVSNYCIQAMTFGKDAEGFNQHSHVIRSTSDAGDYDVYNGGSLLIYRYNSISPSSYHSSATHANFSATYNSIPNYPSIYDTRLERGRTLYATSTLTDYGHYLNPAIMGEADGIFPSSLWNVVGGFPPASGGTYIMYNSASSFVMSGTLSSFFNTYGLMDQNGFLKFFEGNSDAATMLSAASSWVSGAKVTTDLAGNIDITCCLQIGDAACLAAFGGVNHVGIWCLDLKQMVREGLRPPYAWNNLDTTRRYKLIAKKTFWDDILLHYDNPSPALSGFAYLLVAGTTTLNPANLGPAITLHMSLL